MAGAEQQADWDRLVDNAKLWGIRITAARMGSPLAGFVRRADPGAVQQVVRRVGQGKRRRTVTLHVPVEFDVEVQDSHDMPSRLVTVLHELAHVLCGHLGAAREHKQWPNRSGNDRATNEFEAETAAFVACRRLDPAAKIPPYLAGYLNHRNEVPDISLEATTRAAGTLLNWIGQWERVPRHLRKQIP